MLPAAIKVCSPFTLQITALRWRLHGAVPIFSNHSFGRLHMRGQNGVAHRRFSPAAGGM